MPLPQVRLAVAAEPGADLYNAYHLLTQLVGLYAQAAQHDPHRNERGLWNKLAEQGVEDLGELVLVWDRLTHQRLDNKATAQVHLHAAVSSACRRTEVVVRYLNLWVPFQRWTRLIGRIERKWSRLLAQLEPLVGDDERVVRHLRERAMLRSKLVFGLYEKYTAEGLQSDAAFAAGAQWLANGGLSA